MVITHTGAAGSEENLFSSRAIGALFRQADTRWQDFPEPMWQREGTAWFTVVLPFLSEGRTRTLAQVQSRVGEQPVFAAQDVVARLRAFHDWLDSLPPVPHIPLEALDRGNLY